MKAKILTALAAALALAACAAPEYDHGHERGHEHEHRHDHAHEHRGSEGREGQGGGRFECENGLYVQARRAGGNRMELNMDGKTAVLSGDTAASGERYVSANGLYGKATAKPISSSPTPTATKWKLPAARADAFSETLSPRRRGRPIPA